jgi:hypothetical protein
VADPRFVQDECQHCRCEPVHVYRPSASTVPAACSGECHAAALTRREQLDRISDDEAWLWRLVDEADQVFAAAPPAPDAGRLAAAEQTLAQAKTFEERIQMQVRAAVGVLAAPLSWLRPAYRATVARQLRDDRATAVMAAVQLRRAAEVRDRLRAQAGARSRYLSEHRVTLAAGRNARAELLLVIDDLIDGYAQLSAPPAWFRYGIGAPETTPDWLGAARAAVAARRRMRMDDAVPLELRWLSTDGGARPRGPR